MSGFTTVATVADAIMKMLYEMDPDSLSSEAFHDDPDSYAFWHGGPVIGGGVMIRVTSSDPEET